MSDDSDEDANLTMRGSVRLRRNRAVAEREASRLARPEAPSKSRALGHASRKKSSVSSTPFGILPLKKMVAAEVENDVDDQWCGPFSVARQMIAAREDARAKREAEQMDQEQHPLDEIVEEVKQEKKRKANPSMQWKGKVHNSDGRSNLYVLRKKRFVRQQKGLAVSGSQKIPSLFSLCVEFLVDNFEFVEGLGPVGSDIRRSICASLVTKGKMNGAAFDTIAESGIESLELIDCAAVTQDQLSSALGRLIASGLQALILNHAGRAFGSKAVSAIVSSTLQEEGSEGGGTAGEGRDVGLFALSIGGAYLLKDDDASTLVEATSSTLSSIEFKACPFLGPSFSTSISENFASSANNGCLLELSLEDVPLTKECLLTIGSASDALLSLKSLSLRQIEGIDDEVVSILLNATRDLEAIDFSNNSVLTDETLSSVRKSNKRGTLRSLQLSGLRNLSLAGLEALFTPNIPGLPNAPKLRKLNLASCSKDAVSDAVIELATNAYSAKPDSSENTTGGVLSPPMSGGMPTLGGLVAVNVSGSCITDKSLEILAACSFFSLRELDVSFCAHISDQGLGFLVSKAGPQLAKIHIWGDAQITDEFLDGHGRVDEGGLEIIGAWMKRSGKRSLR